MWEARASDLDALLGWATGPLRAALVDAGATGVEVYRGYDGPDRVVVISHWASPAAAAAAEPAERGAPGLVRAPHAWLFTGPV